MPPSTAITGTVVYGNILLDTGKKLSFKVKGYYGEKLSLSQHLYPAPHVKSQFPIISIF